MKLHHLRPAEGASTDRTRVGRGRAGARGKTAGRGTKGTGARKTVPTYFEGGQMPYQRRVPKLKGFSNPNRKEYTPVNVEVLATYFDADVTPEALYAHGLAHCVVQKRTIDGNGFAVDLAHPAGVVSKSVNGRVDVRIAGLTHGLAVLHGFEYGKLFFVL